MKLRLIINYSRSGGTLLSKCIASNPNVILLSEVNPFKNASLSIAEQLKLNYNIYIEPSNYLLELKKLVKIAEAKNLKIVIRDWTFINFTPHWLNNFKPSNQLENLNLLQKHFEVIPIIFLRDAIDVWISRWFPKLFFDCYENYLLRIIDCNLPVFKFEDYVFDSNKIFKNICDDLKLEFKEQYINNFNLQNISGDKKTNALSRGENLNQIMDLRRKRIPKLLIHELESNIKVSRCNNLFGYKEKYLDRELEKKNFQNSLIQFKYLKYYFFRKDKF